MASKDTSKPSTTLEAQTDDELTKEIYGRMQIPYLSERHDALKKLLEAEKLKGQIEAVNEFMNKLNREHFDEPIGTPAQYVTQKLLEFTSSLQQQLDSLEEKENG